jgi:hypothetical protein
MHPEELAWKTVDPNDMWVFDKLILSTKLGYNCGPVGVSVDKPGKYIVRPAVNALGLGLGASIEYIKDSTDHLTPGHFWCEIFHGRHLSVDYHRGLQVLCVEGSKSADTFTHWNRWRRTKDYVNRPSLLMPLLQKYEWVNCEFIGDKLIEVHLRRNVDFDNNIDEFIPVWEGESTTPPSGYEYIDYPDIHGRIGAFVK